MTKYERLYTADEVDGMIARAKAAAPVQPEQEPVIFYRCNGCGHAYERVPPTSCDCMEAGGFDRVEYYTTPPAAAQSAPVHGCQHKRYLVFKSSQTGNCKDCGALGQLKFVADDQILSATPPAARTWVDLTPDDIQNCYGGNVDDFARALLAKSKERNT
jgi:hypothetical protein